MTMIYFDEVMARHPRSENEVGEPICAYCGAYWPCDAYELAWHWDKELKERREPPRRIDVRGCITCEKWQPGIKLAPPHDPSPRCQSGGHEHCSCDTCF